ncbi:MAG: hypothetical protein V4485_00960, partial [Pseudomonadota bacterium]
ITKALLANDSVTSLRIEDNKLGDNGTDLVAQVLKQKSQITQVNLSNNEISSRGICALSKVLGSVVLLNLSNNPIGHSGAAALFKMLHTNSSITGMSLSSTGLDNASIRGAFPALAANKTVTLMSVSDNCIGDDSASDIARLIEGSATLKALNLKGNNFTIEGQRLLLEALKSNSEMKLLLTEVLDGGQKVGLGVTGPETPRDVSVGDSASIQKSTEERAPKDIDECVQEAVPEADTESGQNELPRVEQTRLFLDAATMAVFTGEEGEDDDGWVVVDAVDAVGLALENVDHS